MARAGQRSGASSFRLASSFKLRSVTSFQSTATHLGKALAACCAFMNSCVHRLRWYGSGVSPRTLTLSAQPTSKRHMLRRFLKKNVLIQDVGAGLIQMSYLGKFGSRVAYPLAADNVLRLLPCRLRGVNQPVNRTRNRFARPRPTLLACLWTHMGRSTPRCATPASS